MNGISIRYFVIMNVQRVFFGLRTTKKLIQATNFLVIIAFVSIVGDSLHSRQRACSFFHINLYWFVAVLKFDFHLIPWKYHSINYKIV